MKTDEKFYVKTKMLFIGIISFSVLVGVLCSIFCETKACSGSIGMGLVFAIMLFVFYKEHQRHLKLMKLHGNESVQTVINWLARASSIDKDSYLDFLTNDSLKKLADELEVHLTTYPEKDLEELYMDIKRKM